MSDTALERDGARLARALFPELAEELDAALASHGSESEEDAFDARLDGEAEALFGRAGFAAVIGSPGASRLGQAFESARSAVRELLAGAGRAPADLRLPEPEAFEAAGAEQARLAELLAADERLTPVPAPYGLGADAWREAFRRAAALPGSPFAAEEQSGPLALGSETEREFALVDRAPTDGTPIVAGDPAWTLRLVPATPEPPLLGLNFTHGGPHVALPELLMLQLMRALEGEAPVDGGDGRGSFTWLAGALSDGRLAARHVFDAGAIRITAREVGSQGPHLGARPPMR